METCNNLNEVRRRTPHEITPARWTSDVDDEFQTVLRVNVRRRKGIMAEVAAEITSCDAGVESINIEERNAEISTVNVGITVRNPRPFGQTYASAATHYHSHQRRQARQLTTGPTSGRQLRNTMSRETIVTDNAPSAIGTYSQADQNRSGELGFHFRTDPIGAPRGSGADGIG